MQKLSGLFLFAVLISGVFSSSFAFALVPTAENDHYSVDEDSVLVVSPNGVLINDTNIDTDFFAIMQTNVSFGTLTLNLNGSFIYTPNPNFDSIDSFTYIATNGTYSSNNATVTLSVNSVNDAPVAQNDTAIIFENTSKMIPVLNNDFDIDGDSIIVSSVTQGINGTVTTNGTTITYTPELNFHGVDSFTYTVSDGSLVDNATVSVTVNSVNDTGDNPDGGKVNICHKDKNTISVSVNAISAHLKHGDTLGTCGDGHEHTVDKKVMKEHLKALKKDFKTQEKELKNQLKDLKKGKKSKVHNENND